MALSKDEILSRGMERKVKSVPVPTLDGEVLIRRMSGGDRDFWDLWQLEHSYTDADEKAGRGKAGRFKAGTRTLRSTFATLVLCDEEGTRLFGNNEADNLADVDAQALDTVWDEGHTFNGLGAKGREEAAKNSETAANSGSG